MMLDSINIDQDSKVILMGDFNDTPENDYLNFKVMSNLGIDLYKKGVGSIKYKGVWELIDQFIVSKSLISDSSLYVDKKGMDVILFGYLLEKDKEFLGYKPRRTYIGPIYNGGVSDHLPILIKLLFLYRVHKLFGLYQNKSFCITLKRANTKGFIFSLKIYYRFCQRKL